MHLAWISLMTVAMTGCGFNAALRPATFDRDAREVPLERPALGVGGLSIAGLSLSRGGATYTVTGREFASRAVSRFELLRGERVAWRVDCWSVLTRVARPDLQFVCIYEPEDDELPPLTLALAANNPKALAGVFFAAERQWRLQGTTRMEVGLNSVETVGWTVTATDTPELAVFVDQLRTYPRVFARSQVDEAELVDLAPLILTFGNLRDARYPLRDDGNGRFRSASKRWPLPTEAEMSASPHHRRMEDLMRMLAPGPARALFAWLRARQSP
ncbi:MAG: hypothetical protein AAF449_19220 [Myxococcota bacterium]